MQVNMDRPPDVIFRVDATRLIGTGHLMRCLALGQAMKDSGLDVLYALRCESESLLERLRREGFRLLQLDEGATEESRLEELIKLAGGTRPWVVFDGYHFTATHHAKLKDEEIRVMTIDDMAHLPRYHVDVILNQNMHAPDLDYRVGEGAKLLLGTEYALLRREFKRWRGCEKACQPKARALLVSFGGSDPSGYTLKALEAFSRISKLDLNVTAIVGGASSAYEEIQAIAVKDTRIVIGRNVEDMSVLMAEADLALTSGGSTVWELAFMGVPSIIIRTSEPENFLVDGLRRADCFIDGGEAASADMDSLFRKIERLAPDEKERGRMSTKSQTLVDGRGADRVIAALAAGGRISEGGGA
jgi:UDP-2,4-diacetamido-2,4,6-trideoxy-beta-L-altropyranose hydrolase